MNWYGLGKQSVINLDKVVSVDKKDDNKIEIFFVNNSLASKIVTLTNEKERDKAFQEIYDSLLDLDEEDE